VIDVALDARGGEWPRLAPGALGELGVREDREPVEVDPTSAGDAGTRQTRARLLWRRSHRATSSGESAS
jgi:hypothetical protein